ncbi:spb1 [Ecytonucleospora hepatopenaei]|uniref:Spb1 n=1 Tax=Ecytonucleospora hepatopenaei TaxID=646526 RepID=A0A1W0E586_9MICR|nr:spb1 [Ecytonucleospora hepatopenaei]
MAILKKQRIDKYYTLAKEKGYRSRAAFKLLEINKKYDFLKNCRVAVDLCAAPGGWSQILMQEMPPTRKIIGVDLAKIQNLGDCVFFQSDITSMECRRELVNLLDNHKVDIFVHDGAPNFGNDKEKDVFVQNDLVLSALKLATEFLGEGGIFVTKVFRSNNFIKIVNLMRDLFGQVNVTKPLSSRDESAETFVIGRNFLYDKEIDPKVFDSNILFATEEKEVDIYKKISLSDFICSKNPFEDLKNSGSIEIDFNCKHLNNEIKECCKDLKVLGIKELRNLVKMRQKIVRDFKNKKLIPEEKEVVNKFTERFVKEEKESEEEDFMANLEEDLKKLEKMKKKKSHAILDDKVFNMEKYYGHEVEPKNTFTDMQLNIQNIEKENEEKIINEDSTESEDFDLNSDELECLAMLKEDPEEFKQATVDKDLVDSDDELLPGEGRGAKRSIRHKKQKKWTKKELEALGRKRARALRRSTKIVKDIEIEDEQEEAVVYKKVFKNQLKKETKKRRLVFANVKGGQVQLPRGQGRCIRLDRRMKHDLYIEKNKKANKKINKKKLKGKK